MTNAAPVEVVGTSPLKLLATMGIGGLGMTAGIAMIIVSLLGMPFLLATGWMIVAAIGALVVVALVTGLVRNRPRIELDGQGFTVHSLFSSKTRRWHDIEGEFVVIKAGFSRAIGYRLTPAYKAAHSFQPNKLFAGNDDALSGAFALSYPALAARLNERKRAAVATAVV